MANNYTLFQSCLDCTFRFKNNFYSKTTTSEKNNWAASITLVISLFFAFQGTAQTLYWNTDNINRVITTANWNTSASAPYTSAWVESSNIVFTANSSITYDGGGVGYPVHDLTIINASTVNWTPGPPYKTLANEISGAIRTFDIGTGSILNWNAQRISTAPGTGFIKTGAGAWFFGPQPDLFTGGFTLNEGTVILGLGTDVLGSGTLTINGGTLSANGTQLKSPDAIANIVVGGDFMLGSSPTVVASSDGSITLIDNVDLGSNATRRITVGGNITTNQTGVYTFNGIISGSDSSVIFDRLPTATGMVVLGGANTYDGGTTIQAGIVNLGASGVLPDTGNITLSGGTLKTGLTTGFTETAGALALTANSTIALGTGSHSMTFAASNGVSWTSGAMLTITGWNGVYNGTASATAGRLFIGSDASGITTPQLAQIQFTNPSTGLNHAAVLLSNGEIVPACRPFSATISESATICSGESTNIWIDITGDNSPYTLVYSGSPSGGGTINNYISGTSIAVNPEVTTNYTITSITDAINCPATTVTGSAEITVATFSTDPTGATGNALICSGESTTLTVAGGIAGTEAITEWFDDACEGNLVGTGNSITVSPTATTTYYVRYNGTCNITNCAAVTVIVNTPSVTPTVVSGAITINSGGSTTLSVTGGAAGIGAIAEWFTGSCGGTLVGTGNSITVSPTAATTYYVRYANLCNTTACTTVTVSVSENNNLYWNTDEINRNINTANWNTTASDPYTSAWLNSSNIIFTANSNITYVGSGVIPVGNLTITNASTVNWTPSGGSYSTRNNELAGAIRTFDIGAGSRLNWNAQSISSKPGAGFIKTGAGAWVMGPQAGSFPGGFTLNEGTVVIANVTNVLGTGTLTINGGTLSANTGPQPRSPNAIANIIVGGDFMLGSSPTVVATFDGSITLIDNVALGSNATRRITVGGNITTGSTGVYTFNGIISGSDSSVIFDRLPTATGMVVLGGANTYNGGTTIQAGIVNLGASGVLPDTGNITLSGGTLKTGLTTGFTETAGALALTSNSTIALGTGSHSMTFAASNGVSWTSGAMVTITGWSGVYNGTASATAGRLFIGSDASGITTPQLAQIQFTNPSTGLNHAAVLLSNGEIVPACRPISATISGSATICIGSSTNISVAITGENSPYTLVYSGSPSGGSTVNNYVSGTSIAVNPEVTTNYTITSVTDAIGCTVFGTPSDEITVTVDSVKPGITVGGTQESSNVGISVMQQNAAGPENRNNGHLILEAKTKGFVITRMPTVNLPAGAAAVKGMLVYDTTENCLKMYNGTTWGCLTPSCPD